ncbi:MAG: S8 family peptidase [Pseudomonadota bacterium]
MKHSTATAGLRALRRFALAATLLMVAPLAANAADAGYTDRIIVKYRTAPANAVAETAQLRGAELPAARMGLAMRRLRITALGSQVLKADRKLTLAEAEQLAADIAAADPNVEYAEPDRIMRATFTPNDPRYNEQWHYFESTGGINAPLAWDRASGSGVVVAVVDTGYRPHVDLSGAILPGYDFISDLLPANDGDGRDADARDPGDWEDPGECGPHDPFDPIPSTWHGTHVIGTIAARTNNARGVAGVAFNARVVPVRVLGKCGGFTSDIADGVLWAAGGAVPGVPANGNPAKVINISLGSGGGCGSTMQNAVGSARALGASVIAAAGNSNTDAFDFSPAACDGAVAVASVGRAGGKASTSNYGTVVKLAAPGGEKTSAQSSWILSTFNTGTTTPGADTYGFYSGTSMAAPHVSGVAALMLSVKPSLTPDDVTFLLQSTSRHFPGACAQCGAGIVNARAAVDAATGTPPGVGEVEPNDTRGTAQANFGANTIVNSTMSSSSDSDYFKVSLPAGRTLLATLIPNPFSDYDLQLYDSAGTVIKLSRNGTGVVDTVTTTNTGGASATYYVRVVYYSGGTGGTNGKYAVRLNW